jgi:predicted PurR-regulated permease PerM
MSEAECPTDAIESQIDSQTVALRVIAWILILGAMSLLASLMVPFSLALVLAIALSPVADRIERAGGGRTLGALACLLAIVLLLAATSGLLVYQAGSVLQDADKHLKGFSRILAQVSRLTGGDRLIEALSSGSDEERPEGTDASKSQDRETDSHARREGGARGKSPSSTAYWDDLVREGARTVGSWLTSGLGGLFGLLGGVVIFLALLYYMLETRDEWIERIRLATTALGLRPRNRELERVRKEIVTYFGWLSLVATGYVIVVSLSLWVIGLPQPFLWGAMAGLLEFIPYFGPLIASALPFLVSLSLGGGWWQPAAVAALFVGIHTVEGYVVTPMLYSRAIRFNPVMILVGVLFFGWLWGPLGLTVALPMMIILRGLLAINPEAPALHALVDPEDEVHTAGIKADPQQV